jgi:hypothetical protein
MSGLTLSTSIGRSCHYSAGRAPRHKIVCRRLHLHGVLWRYDCRDAESTTPDQAVLRAFLRIEQTSGRRSHPTHWVSSRCVIPLISVVSLRLKPRDEPIRSVVPSIPVGIVKHSKFLTVEEPGITFAFTRGLGDYCIVWDDADVFRARLCANP